MNQKEKDRLTLGCLQSILTTLNIVNNELSDISLAVGSERYRNASLLLDEVSEWVGALAEEIDADELSP